MPADKRYMIGIDLGTTNSALAYVDSQDPDKKIQLLQIPQLIAPGESDSIDTLPSFLYLPDSTAIESGRFSFTDELSKEFCVGSYARKVAGEQPSRVISSAKSWLCSPGHDPSSEFLPAIDDAEKKMSPVNAMTNYLKHLKFAWNSSVANSPEEFIENQEVVLTVPASFNALARELTVMAAEACGIFPNLLEEPQAAFYSWIHENEESWREKITANSSILVVDIGGGTTDFSLIGVNDNDGNMELQRLAVGNHLLLGGDNMDFTLAFALQQKLGKRLNSRQFSALVHQCRQAKEKILGQNAPESIDITILGSGSSLIGGSMKTELSSAEVDQFIIQAFLPDCSIDEKATRNQRSGLRSFGLNFESDAAISRHLAEFLNGKELPKTVLYNGGVTNAHQLRERLSSLISSWAEERVEVLADSNPDLAVAKGDAWYAYVRQGNSIRIKAGSALSYYVGLESSMPAMPGFDPPVDAICVIPQGTEDGTSYQIPIDDLALLIGEDSQFRFFCSNERPDDAMGSVVQDADFELQELPALHKNLSSGEDEAPRLIPINMTAVFTEIGTVQIWGEEKSGEGRWRLEFDLSSQGENQN